MVLAYVLTIDVGQTKICLSSAKIFGYRECLQSGLTAAILKTGGARLCRAHFRFLCLHKNSGKHYLPPMAGASVAAVALDRVRPDMLDALEIEKEYSSAAATESLRSGPDVETAFCGFFRRPKLF